MRSYWLTIKLPDGELKDSVLIGVESLVNLHPFSPLPPNSSGSHPTSEKDVSEVGWPMLVTGTSVETGIGVLQSLFGPVKIGKR